MQQDLSRRRFLGAAAGAGAAAAAGGVLAPSAGAHRGRRWSGGWKGKHGRVPDQRIGIQLYSLRDAMTNKTEAAAILTALAKMGYREVELAGHYGWTASEFRSLLDSLRLRAVSGHDGFDLAAGSAWEAGYRETLEYAAEVGQKFTGFAWFPGPYTTEYFKFLAGRFNRAGELAAEYGLQFFYHNHDFEFTTKQPDGTPNYNILLEETDEELVKFELDLYWIVYGGENPLAYLAADPDRYPLYHVKDRTWKDRGPDVQDWEDVGPGSIDFPDIFAAGDGKRLDKHYIVEHDQPSLSHPDLGVPGAQLATARAGVAYLQDVTWK